MNPIAELKTKQELVDLHVARELERDWDGTLETMIDEPFYEHYPLGVRVSGREAVKEMWIRQLDVADFVSEARGANLKQWFTDDSAVLMFEWEVTLAGGTTMPTRTWALFTFKDGLIESERIYGDENAARMLAPVFAGEFMNHPGVERIVG